MISIKTKFIFGFIFVFFANQNLWAKNSIQIHFPGAENQKAIIWTYKDLISLERIVLFEKQFDAKGNMSFESYNNQVTNYNIEIQYFRISFYVEPKKDYQLEVDAVDFNNRNYYPKMVVGYLAPPFKIVKPEAQELNEDLYELTLYFDDFIDKNHLQLRLGNKSWKLVDSLKIIVDSFLVANPNDYLKSYAEIQFVQLRMLSNQYGEDWVVKTYFDPKKIAYNNPAFMSFFSSFWTKYISSRVTNSIRQRLDSVINKEQSYQALSALLAEDSLLTNPVLRELVILRNIPQLYSMPDFNKKALINILYDISASKYSKEHQRIAVNLRTRLQALSIGDKAPDFELIDIKGDTLSLERLAGKYIYFQFWDDECIECLSQMKFTKELNEKFDDIIAFVHVSLDRNKEDMMSVIENQNFNWHFVFLEDKYYFIQDFQLSVLPRAILIDKKGNIVAWDSRLPTDYFEDYFLKMLNDKKGNLDIKNQMRNGSRL